jgi:hypothetical protein
MTFLIFVTSVIRNMRMMTGQEAEIARWVRQETAHQICRGEVADDPRRRILAHYEK